MEGAVCEDFTPKEDRTWKTVRIADLQDPLAVDALKVERQKRAARRLGD
jgi:hypothetical protein